MKKVPRRLCIVVAVLLAGLLIFSAVWYLTACRAYGRYMERCRSLPVWEEEFMRGYGSDAAGYNYNVKRPDFGSWTGNLGLGMPSIALENGEEIPYTDSLILWPSADGEWEIGAILYTYREDGDEIACTGHQLYIDTAGSYIPYGDASDADNAALLEEHRENVTLLLERARELWGPEI